MTLNRYTMRRALEGAPLVVRAGFGDSGGCGYHTKLERAGVPEVQQRAKPLGDGFVAVRVDETRDAFIRPFFECITRATSHLICDLTNLHTAT